MLSQGETVVYKCKGVYRVEDVGTLNFTFADTKKRYYTLQSLRDERDRAYIPTDDESNIRRPMDRDALLSLIDRMKEIEVLRVKNEKLREQEYKECISGYSPENWIRVLKTLYKRTQKRGSITSIDKRYQQILENALYSEISYVLQIPESEVEHFIQEHIKE